jgi:hypothetical protein
MSAASTALVRASSFIGNVTSDTSGSDLMVLMVRRGSIDARNNQARHSHWPWRCGRGLVCAD